MTTGSTWTQRWTAHGGGGHWGALRALSVVALVGLGAGCKHRAVITSNPPGAEVRVDGRYVGVTPVEVAVSRMPWASNKVRVKLRGRRWTEVELSRWKRKSEHEVLLVRKHGRAGTWTPDEAQP